MTKVLPQVAVTLTRMGLGAQIDLSHEPDGGKTKFGGTPDWLQSNETPVCPHCHQKMSFVCQIDSFDHAETDFALGPKYVTEQYEFSGGMIYTFFCFSCSHPVSLFQTT